MTSELRMHGRRLTALRNIFELTQADLASRLNVTQSFLSQVEGGRRPMPEALPIMASREFNLPLAFFSVSESPLDIGPVTFRKSSRATGRDENRLITLYAEASRLFRTASEASGYRQANLPQPSDYDDDPELVAEAMRQHAGLAPDEPVNNSTRAIERFGVGVVDNLDHLEEGSRGHTAISRPSAFNARPLVALVADLPGAVKRLTVLHELGHLIFDQDLEDPVAIRSPEEKRAYRFAGSFLLPRRVVERRVSETLNLHGYLPIKADYGISVGAIVLRARDLGVISAPRSRSLLIQLSSQGWRDHEPVPVADERPLLLGQALRKAYGNQATAKAALDIGTSPAWISQWIHGQDEPPPEKPARVVSLADARSRRAHAG